MAAGSGVGGSARKQNFLWNDPERRIVLESLRSFWIELGNELPTAGGRDGADLVSNMPRIHTQLSTITQIHTQLMAGFRSAMH